MVKHFCDRCKLEAFSSYRVNYYDEEMMPVVIDLCTSCYVEFRKFLEDPTLHYDHVANKWFGGRI